jgi:hypothetical protein
LSAKNFLPRLPVQLPSTQGKLYAHLGRSLKPRAAVSGPRSQVSAPRGADADHAGMDRADRRLDAKSVSVIHESATLTSSAMGNRSAREHGCAADQDYPGAAGTDTRSKETDSLIERDQVAVRCSKVTRRPAGASSGAAGYRTVSCASRSACVPAGRDRSLDEGCDCQTTARTGDILPHTPTPLRERHRPGLPWLFDQSVVGRQ